MQYCQTSVAGLLLLGNMDGEFTRKRENIALRLSAEIGFYLISFYLPAVKRDELLLYSREKVEECKSYVKSRSIEHPLPRQRPLLIK